MTILISPLTDQTVTSSVLFMSISSSVSSVPTVSPIMSSAVSPTMSSAVSPNVSPTVLSTAGAGKSASCKMCLFEILFSYRSPEYGNVLTF